MKISLRNYMWIVFFAAFMMSCIKKDEPFEYPDDPVDLNPTWITETERTIAAAENWIPFQSANQCNPNLHVTNLARYELNYSRGFASIQLLPDSSTCNLEVELKTEFTATEISKYGWNENIFEFTYSEFSADSVVELRLALYYKNLELDFNIAPALRKFAETDTTNGLFKFYFDHNEPIFEINGKPFNPDFSKSSGNLFSTNGDISNNYFSLKMSAIGEENFSFIEFNYLRILRFGVKDV